MSRPLVVLFDIDGTLLTTGGAGAVAFEELGANYRRMVEAWCAS